MAFFTVKLKGNIILWYRFICFCSPKSVGGLGFLEFQKGDLGCVVLLQMRIISFQIALASDNVSN